MASSDTPESRVEFIAAIAQPGDTVIIAFSGQLDDADIEWLNQQFQPIIDRGVDIQYTDQVSDIVVVRPGEAAAVGFEATAPKEG